MSDGARTRPGWPLAGAAVFAAGVLVCGVIAPKIAAAGWLIGFAFWSEVAVGSLALIMIHRLTGGRWGYALRPVIEPLAAAIPLLLALIIPVFVAAPALFPWVARPPNLKPDVLSAYLNIPFFVARSLIALSVWSALAFLLPRLPGARGQLLAALGLAFHAAVIGAIGVDWFLSLEPPFRSSSFGASLAVTQLIAALAFALVLAPEDERSAGDLGGLLLAFVLGITYIDFMAVLVIWYGDLPSTTTWFVARDRWPWSALAAAAFALGAVVPIFALFPSRVRNDRSRLRVVAASALVGLLCYDAYLIAPPIGALALVPAVLATAAIGLLLMALVLRRTVSQPERPAYGD